MQLKYLLPFLKFLGETILFKRYSITFNKDIGVGFLCSLITFGLELVMVKIDTFPFMKRYFSIHQWQNFTGFLTE